MKAKWIILGGIALIVAGMLAWILALPHDWQTWLGFSRQDYFVTGQNYAFYSGIGPMMLTTLGFGTIIGGLWKTHNCHYDGCWNIGKYKINGTPWCDVHQQQGLEAHTTDELLRLILDELRAIAGGSGDRAS